MEFGCTQVSDFGLSIPLDTGQTGRRSRQMGTLAYCGPEVCQGDEVSFASDVYSFGVILWELYTAERPYAGMSEYQIIAKKVCSHNARELYQ